jgi:TonB family protein
MALRCLLFSSDEEMVQPIWQVLADLGIEGEYCGSAVDAVEKVTTQLFQIVITDWEDQPEAAFLLKTARDLKAAQRPLTLAIVSDDARLPEALQAGANSVLVKPICTEQVRDTMSTACELLRSKSQGGSAAPSKPSGTAAMAAAAASSGGASAPTVSANAAVASPAAAPASVSKAPENAFRAGEFLQSQSSAPGTHFDTECDVQKSLDQAAAAEVDALTELEPVASAVAEAPAEPVETQEPLSGWAALQARLTKSVPPPVEDDPAKSELLSYGETHAGQTMSRAQPASLDKGKKSEETASTPESAAEAALFAYMAEGSKPEPDPSTELVSQRVKPLWVGAVALACIVLLVIPQTRHHLGVFYRDTVRAGARWLNPQPVVIIQAAPQHENFGQAGDEYKLPVTANIPDATTDPSQIRVLPVIDPTAKTPKGLGANGEQAQATAGDSNPTDQNQADQGQASPSQPQPDQSALPQVGEPQLHEQVVPSVADTRENTAVAPAAPNASATDNAPAMQAQPPQHAVTPPVPASAPAHTASAESNGMIPMSLKSQTASMTPEASGNMPVEAAMASIEPVKLTESVVRGFLAQSVDPAYPDGGKASGQGGIVVLQVLIGRDGSVQDAMFIQGSLAFARAAIDAVKLWRFKPYSLNGRPVAVQSLITLNFKPPV